MQLVTDHSQLRYFDKIAIRQPTKGLWLTRKSDNWVNANTGGSTPPEAGIFTVRNYTIDCLAEMLDPSSQNDVAVQDVMSQIRIGDLPSLTLNDIIDVSVDLESGLPATIKRELVGGGVFALLPPYHPIFGGVKVLLAVENNKNVKEDAEAYLNTALQGMYLVQHRDGTKLSSHWQKAGFTGMCLSMRSKAELKDYCINIVITYEDDGVQKEKIMSIELPVFPSLVSAPNGKVYFDNKMANITSQGVIHGLFPSGRSWNDGQNNMDIEGEYTTTEWNEYEVYKM
ncbi:hypothetical protein ENSA7_69110 [Enhygromyxa salina]|uniref:Uncharacterized protein n=1 Tax=Enhygromyxa salina TaxID=215803 RepID=A0A2S9XTA4_9BACT|nr:hypothetical protein ENSA7_69110 [Enhygromyxa salina]